MPRLFLIAAVLMYAVSTAGAHPPGKTFTYPRVYGVTGHLYGPTQAYYQYQRQYGHPWHGYNGITLHGHRRHSHHRFGGGYPGYVLPGYGGYAPYPYGGYGIVSPFSYLGGGFIGSSYGVYAGPTIGIYSGPVYGPAPLFGYGPAYAPGYVPSSVIGGSPATIPGGVFNNSVTDRTRQENRRRWLGGIDRDPVPKSAARLPKPSGTAAKLKSLRVEVQGNAAFRRQDYPHAIKRYRQAISAAEDRAEPYFRLGLVFAATGNYLSAVKQIRRGLEIDPTWPQTGLSLEESFGASNRLARLSTIRGVADWVREDIRDPDRLFLLGVLLHFNDDDAQAKPFFETALRLAAEGEHIKLFLRPPAKSPKDKNSPARVIPPAPADPRPPVPEPPTDEPLQPEGPSLRPPVP